MGASTQPETAEMDTSGILTFHHYVDRPDREFYERVVDLVTALDGIELHCIDRDGYETEYRLAIDRDTIMGDA